MIGGLRRAANRHPRGTALVVLALFAAIYALPILLMGPVDLTEGTGMIDFSNLVINVTPQAALAGVILAIVALLGWWRQTGLTSPIDWRGWRLCAWIIAVPAGLLLVVMAAILMQDPGPDYVLMLALILLFNLFVGIFEETLFRGVVFHGLRARHGLWTALFASSLLFGAFHAVNLAIGQDLLFTLLQILNAFALGLFFAALVLQSNSLWPAIVLHAIWNSYAMSGQLAMQVIYDEPLSAFMEPSVIHLILPTALFIGAIWIVRRWQRRMPPPIPSAAA